MKVKMYKKQSQKGNWIYDSAYSQQTAIGNFFKAGSADVDRYFLSITVDQSTLPQEIEVCLDTFAITDAVTQKSIDASSFSSAPTA